MEEDERYRASGINKGENVWAESWGKKTPFLEKPGENHFRSKG